MIAAECHATFTDAYGGPPLRCRRPFAHGGPHDTLAVAGLAWLTPPAEPVAVELTPAEMAILDRALGELAAALWAGRRGQSAAVNAERDRIARLRARLVAEVGSRHEPLPRP